MTPCGSFTAHTLPPSYPFAARGPLSICHGPQGGHLAHFGKPWFKVTAVRVGNFLYSATSEQILLVKACLRHINDTDL